MILARRRARKYAQEKVEARGGDEAFYSYCYSVSMRRSREDRANRRENYVWMIPAGFGWFTIIIYAVFGS